MAVLILLPSVLERLGNCMAFDGVGIVGVHLCHFAGRHDRALVEHLHHDGRRTDEKNPRDSVREAADCSCRGCDYYDKSIVEARHVIGMKFAASQMNRGGHGEQAG
ncbi:MAG: hypothetical protein EOP24_44895 [Hyphomicrobiales bacterium]|nr:MAG: hypothetical protein EOP24_44895 [Hyphomicrobiales bacterium]